MVMSASNKTCESDSIPSKLIKSSTHILAPVLKKLINTSLQTGHFCSSLLLLLLLLLLLSLLLLLLLLPTLCNVIPGFFWYKIPGFK